MSVWRQKGEWFCKDCGYCQRQEPEFLDHFFAPKVCPGCGDRKTAQHNPWMTRTWAERRTFTGKWYLPWTWFRENVEVKDEHEMKAY